MRGGGGEGCLAGLAGAALDGGAMGAGSLAGGGGLGLPLPGEPVPIVPLFSTGGWLLVGNPGSSSGM